VVPTNPDGSKQHLEINAARIDFYTYIFSRIMVSQTSKNSLHSLCKQHAAVVNAAAFSGGHLMRYRLEKSPKLFSITLRALDNP